MPARKKLQAAPVRRSERLRLRKEAAVAAEAAKSAGTSEPGQQEPEQLAQQPRQLRRRNSRVSNGGGVTRRGRPSRQNMPVTSTPYRGPSAELQMNLFGRFMDGIFHAARESYAGENLETPIASPNQNEQPTQSQQGWVSGQELRAEDGPLTEELDIIVSMVSSDSE